MIQDIIDPDRTITRQQLEIEIMLKVNEIKQRIAVLQVLQHPKKL